MQETEKYKLKKPDAEDFFSITDFNENADKIEQALGENAEEVEGLKAPYFDDSGTVEGISSFTDFMEKVKSKMNIFQFFRNFKAGMQFILHTGMIVDNYATKEKGFLPDATLVTALKEQLDEQNNNIGYTIFANIEESHTSGDLLEILKNYFNTGKHNITFMVSNNVSNIPYENSWYTIQTIFSHWTNSIRIIAYALWSNSVYICNFNKSSGNMDFDWQKLVTNSDLKPKQITESELFRRPDTVKYYYNWTDQTNFPCLYGSITIMPTLDPLWSTIQYITEAASFFGIIFYQKRTIEWKRIQLS